jgi:hypothetical protein
MAIKDVTVNHATLPYLFSPVARNRAQAEKAPIHVPMTLQTHFFTVPSVVNIVANVYAMSSQPLNDEIGFPVFSENPADDVLVPTGTIKPR